MVFIRILQFSDKPNVPDFMESFFWSVSCDWVSCWWALNLNMHLTCHFLEFWGSFKKSRLESEWLPSLLSKNTVKSVVAVSGSSKCQRQGLGSESYHFFWQFVDHVLSRSKIVSNVNSKLMEIADETLSICNSSFKFMCSILAILPAALMKPQ